MENEQAKRAAYSWALAMSDSDAIKALQPKPTLQSKTFETLRERHERRVTTKPVRHD